MKKQALISVSDKAGVVPFAKALQGLGYHILSTGGTAKLLKQEGVDCQEVADYTGFPEMLDGRVKTLNPKIHAGILARRPDPSHTISILSTSSVSISIPLNKRSRNPIALLKRPSKILILVARP